jgi:hypothetical protein
MAIRLAEFVVERLGKVDQSLERAFPRFAGDLMSWVEAAKMHRQRKAPLY